MPICVEGETVTIPVQVIVLKAFAHEDRVYYIAKPVRSLSSSVWILSTDGEPLEPDAELLARAYQVLGRIK